MAIGKEYFKVNDLIHGVEAYVGGSSNIPLYVPVKFDTNAAGYGAAMIAQIPYVIQCTSSTDDGYFGIIYPSEGIEYTWNSSTGFYEAAAGQKVIVARPGSICYAMLDSGASINTTTATYGGYVSADTNGVDSTAAGDYVAGKILIEATAYAGASGHFVLIEVMDSFVAGYITGKTSNLQELTGNGAITKTAQYNTCKLTKNTVIAATLADGVAADIGKIVVVFDNGTGAAHTITTSSAMINGIFNTATLGATKGNFVAFQWTGIHWATLGGEGVVFTIV